MAKSRGYEDWVVKSIEDLITEIVDRDGCSYEEALQRIRSALGRVS